MRVSFKKFYLLHIGWHFLFDLGFTFVLFVLVFFAAQQPIAHEGIQIWRHSGWHLFDECPNIEYKKLWKKKYDNVFVFANIAYFKWHIKLSLTVFLKKKDRYTKTLHCLYSRTNVCCVKAIPLAKEMFQINSDDRKKVRER